MTSDDHGDKPREYPELRTQLSLRGLGFEPVEITRSLGIEPSRTWRAGQRTSPRRNPPTVDGWLLQVGPSVSLDFKPQLDALLQQLQPVAETVRVLRDEHSLVTEINCVAYISDVVPALYFTPDQLMIIQRLGATIDVDFMLVEGASQPS